jgi:acyl-CoA synthetase (AMP-forming)/AMP-acid ligase II
MLVSQFLSRSVDHYPDKEALICPERRYIYREIGEKVKGFSSLLLDMNVNKSDRVIVFLENSFESVVSIFGILGVGGVFVVINPQIKSQKLEFIINDSGAKILITDMNHLEQIKDVLGKCVCLEKVIVTDVEVGEIIAVDNRSINVTPFYNAGKLSERINHISKTVDVDLASIIYTSGSTGFPKGVMLTHRNMVSAADSIIEYLGNTCDDIVFNVLPLSFDYGLYQVLMVFRFSGTVVLEKSFIFPHHVLKRIKEEEATGFPIVPTIANILLRLKDLKKYEISSLRYITNTAQNLPKNTIFGLMKAFPHVRIFSMYGLTECKRVSYLPPEKLKLKPDSVGQAMPNTEAFIVDAKGNRITKAGVVGELVVRGSHVMVGYWNKPEETSKVIKPGSYPSDRWLYTGDYFKMDEDKDLYFCGRKDDIIKTSGEKVSPKEIENILYELDGVQEAAVIGVPDNILGQAIKAVVSLKNNSELTEKNIIQHCLKCLEKFMVPKYVEIRSQLPKTVTGKISKKDLS